MKREFLVDEVILAGVAGEVRGAVEIDMGCGTIEQVECQSFHFWQDDTDLPVALDAAQRQAARRIVERVLESDNDIIDSTAPWRASAESVARLIPLAAAKKTMAEYLHSPARRQPAEAQPTTTRARRAQ